MKYVVMETGLSYAIVMDEKGRFIKVPNLNYEVGQSLDFVYEEKPLSKSYLLGRKLRFWAAACLLALVLGGVYIWNNPVSFVLIEINPIVKIESNFFNRVINVKGVNFDGEQLLSGYERKGDTAEEVAKEIAALAMQKGYLHEGNNQIRISGDENEAAIIARLEDYFNGEVTVISGSEEWIPTEPEQEDIPAIATPPETSQPEAPIYNGDDDDEDDDDEDDEDDEEDEDEDDD